MKQVLAILLTLLATTGMAQTKKFNYKMYGQVRMDLFYNSRANEEMVDGLIYLFPKDHAYDADGKDLNSTPNGGFYTLYSRFGIDVEGPKLGKAKTFANAEFDFRGSGTNFSIIRIRNLYFGLDWGNMDLLAGQYWHPLWGEVFPQVMNLGTGAPFQALNRSPMIRYRYKAGGWTATAAAMWQAQFCSAGPEGKTQQYMKNSLVPEFFIGADYKGENWLIGGGIDILSLTPRTTSTMDDKTYKVNERVTSVSGMIHGRYTAPKLFLAAKTYLSSNLTNSCMMGGYGVTSINERTGEQTYAPTLNTSSWVNAVYGTTWRGGMLLGYMKNLGTSKAILENKMYGIGTNIDQLTNVTLEASYNVPRWRFGIEYSIVTAWYGTLNLSNGRVTDTHDVSNHRFVATTSFSF
ncbi:MAG: hypothetical protein ACRCZY_01700 [Phocaeicola sp.]